MHSHPHSASCACGCSHAAHSHGAPLHGYLPETITLLMMLAGLAIGHLAGWDRFPAWAQPAWYAAALLPVAAPIAREGARLWAHGSFMNEFTLMMLAAAGAMAIGEYPESVAVLLFYSFGEKMQAQASDDVRRRISGLMEAMPQSVRLLSPLTGEQREVSPGEVTPGDILIVKPGERLAVDSLLEGEEEADFDTSALTGESAPRTCAPGDELSAGVIPVDREVHARALRPWSDSALSRMMAMIEEAAARKTPSQPLLRSVTRRFTPAVIIMALLVMAVPAVVAWITGTPYDAVTWFRRALVFFVCSCPCALVAGIPLAYFTAIGAAARRGILFKGATHLDSMRHLDAVLLDKTGTITTGAFRVTGLRPLTLTADELLSYAAAIDSESSHPLARAIVEEARARGLAVPPAQGVVTVSHGMQGMVNGHEVLVGSLELLRRRHVAAMRVRTAGSEICVAVDGVYAGTILLEDTVKPDSAEAVSRLRALGVREVRVLSGDREECVAQAATAVGADSWLSSLLPESKHAAVGELCAAGCRVAFAGDGINDAPSIARAHVGIAMGTLGTAMAMQSADVVVAGDSLCRIADGVALARRTRRVIRHTVAFAFAVKGVVMALAACGLATLWAGVFADTGVTVITIAWVVLALRR